MKGAIKDVYGIIGNPVAHSLSPAMHNAAFKELGLNAIYLAFDTTDLQGAVRGIRALGIKGVSVTVPHKEAALNLVDELDDMAIHIGAVNTIINRNGRLIGRNTDWEGAVRAIEEVMPLSQKKVLIIGAGGASRAIIAGCKRQGADVHVANRTVEKAEALSGRFDVSFSGLDIPRDMSFDIIVNTTTCGMGSDTTIPVSRWVIEGASCVMDIVYSPLNTPLLKLASELGKTTIDGLKMLLYQGVRQFELWTGLNAPLACMKDALNNKRS